MDVTSNKEIEKKMFPLDCFCGEDENKGAELTLECGHTFHKNCINKWFDINRTCPTCRFYIDECNYIMNWINLIYSAFYGDLVKVKQILDKDNSIINIQNDNEGWTPLMFACQQGNTHIIKELIERGAQVDLRGNMHTALMIAADHNHIDAVKELIVNRADVNAPDNDGATALFYAAGKGYLDIVIELLAAGANPNIQKVKDGSTAMMHACLNRNKEVYNELLYWGADLTIKNIFGKSAADYRK